MQDSNRRGVNIMRYNLHTSERVAGNALLFRGCYDKINL